MYRFLILKELAGNFRQLFFVACSFFANYVLSSNPQAVHGEDSTKWCDNL